MKSIINGVSDGSNEYNTKSKTSGSLAVTLPIVEPTLIISDTINW